MASSTASTGECRVHENQSCYVSCVGRAPERINWWEQHPAWEDLVRAFTGSTSAPRHLAFLALTRLRAYGWAVVPHTDVEELERLHEVIDSMPIDFEDFVGE